MAVLFNTAAVMGGTENTSIDSGSAPTGTDGQRVTGAETGSSAPGTATGASTGTGATGTSASGSTTGQDAGTGKTTDSAHQKH